MEFETVKLLRKLEIPFELFPHILKGNVLTGEGLNDLLEYIYENKEFTENKENYNS